MKEKPSPSTGRLLTKLIRHVFRKGDRKTALRALSVLGLSGLSSANSFFQKKLLTEIVEGMISDEAFQLPQLALYGTSLFLGAGLQTFKRISEESLATDISIRFGEDLVDKIQTVSIPDIQRNSTALHGVIHNIDMDKVIQSAVRIGSSSFQGLFDLFNFQSRYPELLTFVAAIQGVEWLIHYKFSHLVSKRFKDNTTLKNQLSVMLSHLLRYQETIRLYQMESFKSNEYHRLIEDISKMIREYNKSILLPRNLIGGGFRALSSTLIIPKYYRHNRDTALSIYNFLEEVMRLNGNTMSVTESITQFGSYLPNLSTYFQVVESPTVRIDEDVEALSVDRLTYDQVRFGFSEDHTLFQDISFQIPKGSRVALMAQNGAGKTTLWKLLTRFYEPVEGNILINGQGIRDISKQTLRSSVVVVPQDPVIFEAHSLYDNLCCGADIDEDRVLEIIDQLGLEALIGEEGLHTILGANLSGGQKKRIGIGRALLKQPKPSVYVFDEPTASLDISGQYQILNLFRELSEKQPDAIIMLITHNALALDELEPNQFLCLTPDDMLSFENKETALEKLRDLSTSKRVTRRLPRLSKSVSKEVVRLSESRFPLFNKQKNCRQKVFSISLLLLELAVILYWLKEASELFESNSFSLNPKM